MTFVMQIVGLLDGDPTPFDGQYLVRYDPERDGRDPDGHVMQAVVETTPDIQKDEDS